MKLRGVTDRIWRWAPFLAWVAWAVGQAFRDRWLAAATFFYIPSPLLAVFLAFCAFHAWRKSRARRATALAALCIVPTVYVLAIENQFFNSRPSPERTAFLRLTHWNVMHGVLGWAAIGEEILGTDPDLCVLSETPKESDWASLAAGLGPAGSFRKMGNLAILARGGLSEPEWLVNGGGLRVCSLTWASTQGECVVFVVDLGSNPLRSRDPLLQRLVNLILLKSPDLVVGDFNSPRRSRALSPLPQGFAHAYETVGGGWSYSWPVPIPVYALDQCIFGPRIDPLRYVLESSWRSDHRRQIFDFRVVARGPGAPSTNPVNRVNPVHLGAEGIPASRAD